MVDDERVDVGYFALGGTIATRQSGEGLAPGLGAAELLDAVPGVSELARIEPYDLPAIASFALSVTDMHRLAIHVQCAFAEGCDAVVISQGTDTLEETAYVLALTLPRGKPVVLTGALRGPTLPGADGAANLLAAFRVAVASESAGLGPLVVLNDEVHAARWVTKAHTSRVSSFASPGTGPLGEIAEGDLHMWFKPAWEDFVGLPRSVDGIDVELVRLAAGVDEALLRAATDRHPAGIVIEGTGGGHIPPALLPALGEALARRIPVVIATRVGAGPSLERTYDIEGGEIDLIRRGVLPAGTIAGHKARLRLLVGRALELEPTKLFPVR
jgi:L-asparaginase